MLQSKSKEDYEPNLQLLVDEGAALAIGVGYMLEPAIEIVAKRNPESKFLLIDNQLQDSKGKPYTLPNVRAVTFKEEEGSFLVGALAGLVSPSGKIGFVGGAEVELIQKFEAGLSRRREGDPAGRDRARELHRQLRQRRRRQAGRAGPDLEGRRRRLPRRRASTGSG